MHPLASVLGYLTGRPPKALLPGASRAVEVEGVSCCKIRSFYAIARQRRLRYNGRRLSVLGVIANGLTLLNLSSSLRHMISGGVLAVAVIVDSLARRSRVSHGRA